MNVIWNGKGALPWQSDDDRYWSGSGSLSDVRSKGFKNGELISERESRGKGMSGNRWNDPTVSRDAAVRSVAPTVTPSRPTSLRRRKACRGCGQMRRMIGTECWACLGKAAPGSGMRPQRRMRAES